MEEQFEQEENSPSRKNKTTLIVGAVLAGVLIMVAIILSLVKTPKKNIDETPNQVIQKVTPGNENQNADQTPEIDPAELAKKYGFDLTVEDVQKKINFAKRYADNWNKDAKLTGFVGVYGKMDLGDGRLSANKAYVIYFTSKSPEKNEPGKNFIVALDENNNVVRKKETDMSPENYVASEQLGYVLPSDLKISMADAFAIAANSINKNFITIPDDNQDNLNATLGLGYNKKAGHVWQYDFRKGGELLTRISVKADTGEVIARYP